MEFPQLGNNCSHQGCGQLDFLPSNCTHCGSVFCSDHLSPFVHECVQFKTNVLTDEDLAKREKERWQLKCAFQGCHVKDVVPMKCPKCHQHFCLSHRHADQHQCPVEQKEKEEWKQAKVAENEKKQKCQEKYNEMKEIINSRLEEAKSEGGAKGAMAKKLALMKLKGRAKGDAAVPMTERVFFTVDCPNKQQNPKPLDLWMSKVWTMGKAIDFIARQARIKNRNNVKDAPKLHLFKDSLCVSNPTDKQLNALLEDNIITDGDALIFKYVENEGGES